MERNHWRIKNMYDLITNNFQGTNITIALTGLPIVITGEVIGGDGSIITLRLRDGSSIYIESSLIAITCRFPLKSPVPKAIRARAPNMEYNPILVAIGIASST